MRLSNKTAIITAAGQGIGRETALLFAREGAKVLATDINEEALSSLAKASERIKVRPLDVTKPLEVHALFSEVDAFDILFNCAGYVANGTILDCTPEDWRRSFQINVDSMYDICRAALPGMIVEGRGSIINMSSVASSVKGVQNRFAYGVTKAAVIGLTKAIAADFVMKGIRCNAICPGTVRTPSLEQRIADLDGAFDENWKAFVSRQPIGRLGEASEIANLALYLGSDESSFTTGAIHVIDGGWSN